MLMRKLLRPVLLYPLLLSSCLYIENLSVQAQEYQGCFLIDYDGALVDLAEICPAPQSAESASSPGTPTLGTGDIQVTLRWATTDDLDLSVTDPNGETVNYYNRTVNSGGQLDVDANAGCMEQNPTPIENVFWPPSQAPTGNYTVTVNLFSYCAGAEPVSFTLTLLVQGNTETLTGTVDEQNPVVSFPFSMPQ